MTLRHFLIVKPAGDELVTPHHDGSISAERQLIHNLVSLRCRYSMKYSCAQDIELEVSTDFSLKGDQKICIDGAESSIGLW